MTADLTQRMELSSEAIHIMEHATAWKHPTSPGYRNHYVAGPEQDSWSTLQELCRRGLMTERRPAFFGDSMSTFAVTAAGFATLRSAT